MLDMKQFNYYIILFTVILLSACNTTKHVPDGQYLLNKSRIHTDVKNIPRSDLEDYLRQTPNTKVLGVFPLQLGIYNIAGKDTSKRWNRNWMRIGDAPVIYDEYLTQMSAQQLQKVFVNKGYINAKVDTVVTKKKKKATVDYYIKSNKPYTLRKYEVKLKNMLLSEIASDTSRSLIRPGMLFDADILDAERQRVSTSFREKGFYNFNKDFLVYSADSSLNDHKVDVNLDLRSYLKSGNDSINNLVFRQYKINRVVFNTNANSGLISDEDTVIQSDTTKFRDFYLISGSEKFISLDALIYSTYISPQSLYSDMDVEKTYSALNTLGPVKYVNISFREQAENMLDCFITIIPAKTISLSTEVEGTYTEGYWAPLQNLGWLIKMLLKAPKRLPLRVVLPMNGNREFGQENLAARLV